MRFAQRTSPVLFFWIGIALAVVFIADLYTPLGVAVWVVYLAPLMLGLFAWRPQVPLTTAALISLLVAVGFMLSPQGTGRSLSIANRSLAVFTVWLIAGVGFVFIRNRVAARKLDWLRTGQAQLAARLVGDQRLEPLGENVLRFFAEYLDAHAGALFISEGAQFRRLATYAVAAEAVPEHFAHGEGLLGQAAKDVHTFVVTDVPDGYLRVASGLGAGKPRHLLIAPLERDGSVVAVLELGFMHSVFETDRELVEWVSPAIAAAVQSGLFRTRLQLLLEETQQQAEELQAQGEELRVNNEELEEQSRALQASQAQLETQQSELEETNERLAAHGRLLAEQRDELERAQAELQKRAAELEQASRYKSEFLANMSHELRTPLNSSMIMAKLLADNPHGTLTPEQVKYAQTISAAGADLLNLINDILDLSKIEAGRIDIHLEPVRVRQVGESLERLFGPVAAQKKLSFQVSVAEETPDIIESDGQRLEQVLKNIVANAIKFTESGSVAIDVSADGASRVAFAVRDTGIGIPEKQREIIFEAFRQADGTTNRKYGGTGLGLSISRELMRLLGGEIRLESEPGRGSTFTVFIPVRHDASAKRARPSIPPPPARVASEPARVTVKQPQALPDVTPSEPPPSARRATAPLPGPKDDRDKLAPNSWILLVVEDDVTFARLLAELARERGFQCLLAESAEEALSLAEKYTISAVVLDVGLPDNSGLSVLDRLKRDPRTRHVPVHVVSANDYSEAALSLGAVGYILKPVQREELERAFAKLEARLTQRVRRVLVVEDDDAQRESIQALLGSRDVQTVGVRSASECLERLRSETFDSMVLDLNLADGSGFSLLETLSSESKYSFPPVIVYTGKDLSSDEEQRLRRYSRSIIIKGAKSPERLLDEVTLFLHQVVSELPDEKRKMLEKAQRRDAALEGRRILVVEDDVRNVFALTSVLEPHGATVVIARNGREALEALEAQERAGTAVHLVLMDIMMPEMDGLTATRAIRTRPEWRKLPIIALTAKAMKNDQEDCIAAGANDYIAKPLDVEKLLSLVRVWMPRC